jgi:nucleotide-binding universal stress UspA family protein
VRILLAVDDSSHSRMVAENLRQRPWIEGAKVGVLSVTPDHVPMLGEFASEAALQSYEHLERAHLERAQAAVDRSVAILRTGGCEIEPMLRRGDPRTEIVNTAKEWRADLIVVGSHGRTGLERCLLGSVAEYVVRHARCSVEVARQAREE